MPGLELKASQLIISNELYHWHHYQIIVPSGKVVIQITLETVCILMGIVTGISTIMDVGISTIILFCNVTEALIG